MDICALFAFLGRVKMSTPAIVLLLSEQIYKSDVREGSFDVIIGNVTNILNWKELLQIFTYENQFLI